MDAQRDENFALERVRYEARQLAVQETRAAVTDSTGLLVGASTSIVSGAIVAVYQGSWVGFLSGVVAGALALIPVVVAIYIYRSIVGVRTVLQGQLSESLAKIQNLEALLKQHARPGIYVLFSKATIDSIDVDETVIGHIQINDFAGELTASYSEQLAQQKAVNPAIFLDGVKHSHLLKAKVTNESDHTLTRVRLPVHIHGHKPSSVIDGNFEEFLLAPTVFIDRLLAGEAGALTFYITNRSEYEIQVQASWKGVGSVSGFETETRIEASGFKLLPPASFPPDGLWF